MKKFMRWNLLIMVVIGIFFLGGCSTTIKVEKNQKKENSLEVTTTTTTTSVSTASSEPTTAVQGTTAPTTASDAANADKKDSGSVLFIGDSRTVGLMEYSDLDADFYASEGMSVYNLNKKAVSVPKVGKVRLDDLLSQKTYDKIYLMLGLNESGYEFHKTVKKYEELVASIREKQPGAIIFIQANLHVTKQRSERDAIYNNIYINQFNSEIAKFADGKKIFYLDVNTLFDDEEGNLSANKSADQVHVFAKYYVEWGEWIERETKLKMEGA